jgi:Glycosyl hydrolase family 3 C-terminal domain
LPQVSVSTPAGALTQALAGQVQVTVRPGGALAAAEHRAATMFTWWDGLPGIGPGGRGRIVLRTSYLAVHDGPYVIGAGGVGRLSLIVNGTEVASGHPDLPADPVEAMVRPGEISEAVEAARTADAAVVVVGSGAATESEGFDRPGLALPGRQDELVRRVAAVGYAWLPGQVMGTALADVLLGQAEPGGRRPVTIPAAEADCPVRTAAAWSTGRAC